MARVIDSQAPDEACAVYTRLRAPAATRDAPIRRSALCICTVHAAERVNRPGFVPLTDIRAGQRSNCPDFAPVEADYSREGVAYQRFADG